MRKEHKYTTTIHWTGNTGKGTTNYNSYERSHSIEIEGKPIIMGSSDPSFRGDSSKYNPEELLVASISACHMLWYLHLCSTEGIVVTHYKDKAYGVMVEQLDGVGFFSEVTLNPSIMILDLSMKGLAECLHKKANKLCYIANSLNFKIYHNPTINAEP